MEEINTEAIVSSLFCVGFEKVDPVLFTYVLANIAKNKEFKYVNGGYSHVYNTFIDKTTPVLKLKFNLPLNHEIQCLNGYSITLRKALPTNNKLIEYFNNLDFTEIVLRKAKEYKLDKYSTIDRELFSKKEIEILKENGYGKKTVLQKIKSIF